MEWFIAALAVLALGVAAVVAAGGGGSMAAEPVRDTYAMTVSDEAIDGATVRDLRFGVALRGYAMDQVDAILDRLAVELDTRDARIAELQAQLAGPSAPPEQEQEQEPVDVGTASDGWEQPR